MLISPNLGRGTSFTTKSISSGPIIFDGFQFTYQIEGYSPTYDIPKNWFSDESYAASLAYNYPPVKKNKRKNFFSKQKQQYIYIFIVIFSNIINFFFFSWFFFCLFGF